MDKRLPAQQLNRPMAPKRPRDPDRFRNIDVTPGDSQQDPQYQRMVADIEALQQRQGWLAGRGAFDKDDLLYLRDKEQEQRFQEQHKRDAEAAAFAAARARAEAQAEQQAAKQLRQQEAARPQHKTHPAPLLGIVSVKPVKQQKLQEHQHLPQPKPATADTQQWQQQQQQQLQQGASQQQEVCQPRQQPAKKARTDASPSQQAQGVSSGQGTGAGHGAAGTPAAADPLQNLLGDYGSEGESDDEQQQTGKSRNAQQQCAAGNAVKLQLPSAEVLLDSELQSLPCTAASIAQGGPHASGDEVTGQTAVVHDVKRLFELHNHSSWV